jgi:hypothetical protein
MIVHCECKARVVIVVGESANDNQARKKDAGRRQYLYLLKCIPDRAIGITR